jgi:hypothetical protein
MMTTPPDFGGTEIEEGLREDLFNIAPEKHAGPRDDLVADPHDDNEAAAPGETCARCGNQLQPGDEARRRADGRWVHEVCPPPTA